MRLLSVCLLEAEHALTPAVPFAGVSSRQHAGGEVIGTYLHEFGVMAGAL